MDDPFYQTYTKQLVSMPEQTATGAELQYIPEAGFTISNSQPFHEKVCMWAKTPGDQLEKREIEVEMCGTAATYLKYDVYKEITIYMKYAETDIEINGNRYFTYDLR